MVAFRVGMCAQDGADGGEFATTDVATRFDVLKQCIRACFGMQLDPNDLYCFVAPEFFFGNVALPKTAYRELVRLCNQLFTAQNFILVPGSVVTYSGSKLPIRKDRFANRLPIFYGGQLLHYEKQLWGGEAGLNGVGRYRNGRHDGLFSVQFGGQTYTFAIEVCMEHDSGTATGYNQQVDVHIITGNTVVFKPQNAIAQRFVLHCNASSQKPQLRHGPYGFRSCKVYDHAAQEIAPNLNIKNQIFYWDLVL